MGSRRRLSRRESGRPTLLDADVQTKLIEATKIGSPMGVAAAYVGIAERTFQEWMTRGYNEQCSIGEGNEPAPVEAKYLTLYEAVTEARATASVQSVMLIRKSAVGGQVTEETTRKYRDADGNVVEEKTVKRTAPDWRAAAWWLERQQAGQFGRKSTQEVHVDGEVAHTVDAKGLAEKVHDNIRELIAAEKEAEMLAIEAGETEIEDAEIVG